MSTPSVSIDWNGSLFVLTYKNLSDGTTLYKYSADGFTWETAEVPTSALTANHAYVSKWTGDRFMIAGNLATSGNQSVSLSSIDGIHFSTLNTSSVQLHDVETNLEYRNIIRFPRTVHLAVGGISGDESTISYSLDEGDSWVPSASSATVFSVSANRSAWNGKVWVAVGEGSGNTIATSADGKEWTGRGKYVFSEKASGVDWSRDQSRWVSVGTGGNTVAYSSDGIFWIGGSISGFSGGNAVQWNGEIWVAAGTPASGSTSIAYSLDGKTWTSVSSMFSVQATSIEWNGTYWTVFGEDPSYNVATSNNGMDWTISQNASIESSSFYNGIYYFRESSGNTYSKSVDGNTWTTLSTLSDMSLSIISQFTRNTPHESVAQIKPLSVATGEGDNTLAYSVDGIQWKGLGSSVFSLRGNRAVWNGKVWVAVGADSAGTWVATSYDGMEWTRGESTWLSEGYDIAWNGDQFVAVGINAGNTGGGIATSTDGTTWTGVSGIESLFSQRVSRISWTGRKWLAYGSGGNTTAMSTNGTTWTTTPEQNATIRDASSVFWESGRFTSASLTGFTATHSSAQTGYESYLAFDGSANTEWRCSSGNYTSTSGVYSGTTATSYASSTQTLSGEWIQLSIPVAKVVKYYTIVFSLASNTTAIPKQWSLFGSNTGSDWSLIDTFAFSTSTPPDNVWKYSQYRLPVNVYSNTTAYSYYRWVVSHTFGETYTAILELDLWMENGESSVLSIYETPVVLKNNVLFMNRFFSISGENLTVSRLADLSGNSLASSPQNGAESVNSVLYGISGNRPITSICSDGEYFFISDLSGNVVYMTNSASNSNLNVDSSYNGTAIDSRLSSIYGSCWNQQYVLFCGEEGISYGRLEAGTSWRLTNASQLFTRVVGVSSNSGVGFVYVPNAIYFRSGEILRVVGPKSYSSTGETAIQFQLKNR